MHSTTPILSTLSTGVEQLAIYDWPLIEGQASRGTVVLVHGLAEHMGRYTHVAAQLNAWGFHVRGYDQYGHGLSSGVRGRLPSSHQFTDDLKLVVDDVRLQIPSSPLILLGHSMGGVVAASFVAQQKLPIDGLVLSSPGFLPQLKAFDKLLLSVMKHLAPHICVDNGLNPHWVARDPQAVLRYKQDPLVHRQISAALAQWIIDAGHACIATASLSHTPTLLLYAGQDHIVRAEGSMAYAESMPSSCLTAHCYPGMFHEIFNDPAVTDVFADLKSWLAHFNPNT